MKVIKNRQVVEDQWQLLTTDELEQGLPATDVIVPFTYWLDQQEALKEHTAKVAVYLNPEDDVEQLQSLLDTFPMIALYFPQFKDGRAYSHARILRDRFNYQGELRAVGDVLRDQLFYMQRCGFDAFQVKDGKDAEGAINGLDDFSVTYQTAADGALPVYRAHR